MKLARFIKPLSLTFCTEEFDALLPSASGTDGAFISLAGSNALYFIDIEFGSFFFDFVFKLKGTRIGWEPLTVVGSLLSTPTGVPLALWRCDYASDFLCGISGGLIFEADKRASFEGD